MHVDVLKKYNKIICINNNLLIIILFLFLSDLLIIIKVCDLSPFNGIRIENVCGRSLLWQ